MRGLKGGSWLSYHNYVRLAFYNKGNPDYQGEDVGFRVRKKKQLKLELRGLRGGAWYNSQDLSRLAVRNRYDPDYQGSGLGFRVIRRTPCEY